MARHYLVTGASSGIGHAVARRLLRDGDAVTGMARRDAGDFAFAELPADAQNRFAYRACDLGSEQQLVSEVTSILKNDKMLDGAVLCHGYGDFGNLEEFSNARIQQMLMVNLASYAMICRQLVPYFKSRKCGDIVFIGSESGLRAGKKGAVYSAAKFGLRGLSNALRDECAASGVRITLINPGLVQSAFFDNLDFSPGEDRDNYLMPEDVADAVALSVALPKGAVMDEINLSPQKKVIRNRN